MPSTVAYLAFILVVPATMIAFAVTRPSRAVLAITIGSFLFLPSGLVVDAPVIPPLHKQSIPAICLLVATLITARAHLRRARVLRGPDFLLIVMAFGAVGTIATNRDPQIFGPTVLQGLQWSEVVSLVADVVLGPGTPFVLGYALFRGAEDVRDLQKALVIFSTIYMPLVLYEVRMSPQLHMIVFGYFPGDWLQVLRSGGFRPQVFTNHGLVLALYMWCGVFAAWSLTKARERVLGFPARPLALMLTVTLFLMNSLGVAVYAILMLPIAWFAKPRTQIRIALVLGIFVIIYPLLRHAELLPVNQLVDYAARYNQERAGSLNFRFEHEAALLERALQRPIFGWGGYGRPNIFDEFGRDLSVTDGRWIIVLGYGGLWRFLCEFGLMVLPMAMALRRLDYVEPRVRPLLGGLALVSAICAIDCLPNVGVGSFQMLFPGVLAGLASEAGVRASVVGRARSRALPARAQAP